MEIILLKKIHKLGVMGDVVLVKPGHAKHFLIPTRLAMRATKENIDRFKIQKKIHEAKNLELKKESETLLKKIAGLTLVFIRHADKNNQLYGSVSTRDILQAVENQKVNIDISQIIIEQPIKTLGTHQIAINLHPEVKINISINIYKNEEEAITQNEPHPEN